MSTDVDMPTSREAALLAEIARLRQLLADAGPWKEGMAADASAAAEAQRAPLNASLREKTTARDDTRQANEAVARATVEHRPEIAIHHVEAARKDGPYAVPRVGESRLRMILESASDFAIFATDLAGRVTDWNFGARNVLGWDEAEMLGRDARIIWTPEDREAGVPENEIRLAREEGQASDERWHLRRDGSRFWASGELMAKRDEAGRLVGYLKILRDRTEQHEAGRRLSESEARLRVLFERLQEGLIIGEAVRDAEGRITDWRYLDVNPAWSDLVGAPGEAAIGRTVRELIGGIEEDWITDVAAVLEADQPVTFTRRVGSLARWYEGRIHRLEGDRFTILFREVTQRYQREQRRAALLDLSDRLRDAQDPAAMSTIGAEIIGHTLGVGRVGYGTVEADGETFVVARDWTAPGYPSLAGTYRMDDYGLYAEDLRRGETVCISDTRQDHRTVGTAAALEAVAVRALINLPLVE